MTMTGFWNIAPYSRLYGDRRFFALMMEVVSTSETSVNFNVTTWRNIPEDTRSCYPGAIFPGFSLKVCAVVTIVARNRL
jgi:hypothetical protein